MIPYPVIDPVAFSIGPIELGGKAIGPLEVHWYGLMYLFGLAGGWIAAIPRLRKPGSVISVKQVEDLIFYLAMGVVLGARVGYVFFYNMDEFLADPTMLLRVWEGGMSFHGGLLGVIIAMTLYSRKIQRNFFDLMDVVATYIPIGLFAGRIGNFIGSELYGRASDVSWAMIFPKDPDQLPRHPSQLYEAFLEGLVIFCLLYWYSAKPRPRAAICSLFVALYGLFRFSVEFVREPDAHLGFQLFGWMTRGQILCLPMIGIGFGVFAWVHWKQYQKRAGVNQGASA